MGSGGYAYCLDGKDVFYAPVTSSGVGAWARTSSYPTDIAGESCVASGGYVYCISGIDGSLGARPTGAVYYARASPSGGLGAWTRANDYPSPSIGLSCAASDGYVYCVGGARTVGTLQSDAVYYASVSQSGVGTWAATTSYPIAVDAESCVSSAGLIYCVAGYSANGPERVNATFYAQISASGVGAWTPGVAYPVADEGLSCVANGGDTYCIGGRISSGFANLVYYYYAGHPANGTGAWADGPDYPVPTDVSCLTSGSTIVCVGTSASNGSTTDVYYASLPQ